MEYVSWECRDCDGEGYVNVATAFEKKCSGCRGTGSEQVRIARMNTRRHFGAQESDDSRSVTQELPKGKSR